MVAHLPDLELEAHDVREVEVDLIEERLVVIAQVRAALGALAADVAGVEVGVGRDVDLRITGDGVHVDLLVVQLGQLGQVDVADLQHGYGHLLVGDEADEVEGGVDVVVLEAGEDVLVDGRHAGRHGVLQVA